MGGEVGFCVQVFVRRGATLLRGEQRYYTSATEAEDVGSILSPYVAGVIVYADDGDEWDDDLVLARHGDVPPREQR